MKSVSGRSSPESLSGMAGHCCACRAATIYGKAGSDVKLSVPTHGNQAIKTGLLRHLMKMAGLTENDL